MKAVYLVLGIGGMLTTYGIVCVQAGINHDISTLVIAGLTGLVGVAITYWKTKKGG